MPSGNVLLNSELLERISLDIFQHPGLKTAEIASRLGISIQDARLALSDLEVRKHVFRAGQTRATRWFSTNTDNHSDWCEELSPDQLGKKGPKERVLDENRHLLGTITDSDVADRTGVSIRTIAGYRKKHGIPGYTGPRKRQEISHTQHPIAILPTAAASLAWQIELDVGNEVLVRYAFGQNLLEVAAAAYKAAQRLQGDVLAISRVGELL